MKYRDRLGLPWLSGLPADFSLGKLYPSQNAERIDEPAGLEVHSLLPLYFLHFMVCYHLG